MRARWNKRGETQRAFIWNGPSEGSDLIILGLRERERKRGVGERGELQIKRKKGRECEGEIEELWFSSTQLQTATAVTSLHLLLALPLLLFLPSFSYFVPLLSAFTLGCISN